MAAGKSRRKKRLDDPKIDLLTTAFNLPSRRMIHNNSQREDRHHLSQTFKVSYDYENQDARNESDIESTASLDYITSSDEDYDSDESEDLRVVQERDDSSSFTTRSSRTSRSSHSVPNQACLKSNKLSKTRSPSSPRSKGPSATKHTSQKVTSPKTRHHRSSSQPSFINDSKKPSRVYDRAQDGYVAKAPPTSQLPNAGTFNVPLSHQPSYNNPPFAPQTTPSLAYSQQSQQQYHAFPVLPPPYPVYVPPQLDIPNTVPPTHHSQMLEAVRPTMGQEVQRIQVKIDQKRAMLHSSPGSSELQKEIETLHLQLNSALNQAVRRQGTQTGRQQLENTQGNSVSLLETPDDPAVAKNKAERSDPGRDLGKNDPVKGSKGGAHDTSNALTRHHLCLGCGSVRSRKYHERHPIAPGKRSMPSLCDGCRHEIHDKGIIEHHCHHVCFGCGIYRSRAFHAKHPARIGDSLLQNYCYRCQSDLRCEEEVETVVSTVSSER